jgi:hypothetical protein
VAVSCRWIPGLVLELPDQKAQIFQIFPVLSWWLLVHTRKVFGEICVRQLEACLSDFDYRGLTCDSCLHQFVFSLCFFLT